MTKTNLLQDWIGNVQSGSEEISPAPLRGLAATLERTDLSTSVGAALPPLWHWMYFLSPVTASNVGTDGHPRRGGFLPEVPLPRRMWAGGRLQWKPLNPIRVGDEARRTSRIASITEKEGRSGRLVFVTVVHEVHNNAGLCLTEEQDIVYKGAPQPSETPAASVRGEPGAWRREVIPNEVLLFRYSALTFNGHRIHYDRPYATEAEGYPGLVVHGPLQATLLLDLLNRHSPGSVVHKLEFKALRPTFDSRPLYLNGLPAPDGKTLELWTQDQNGYLAMRAQVEFR